MVNTICYMLYGFLTFSWGWHCIQGKGREVTEGARALIEAMLEADPTKRYVNRLF